MLWCLLLLLSLSATVIYTSSPSLAFQQAVFAIVGLGLYYFISRIDYQIFRSFTKVAYITSIVLLLVVIIIGFEARGSTRWISLGFFNLQPSELAKLSLILTLASFWSTHHPNWKNIGLSLLLLSPIASLVFIQPDLGTALTISFIWFVMLIAANVSFQKVSLLVLSGVSITPLGWFFLHDYQRNRIHSFFSPQTDPLGIGYNVIQATIAVGSGQLWGRGLGQGTQSRLQFLPEFRTDFIFAFIAEELGFFGSALVVLLYSTIFVFLYKTIIHSRDHYGQLIVIGTAAMLFFQIVVNIGMNIGVMPITGITLPLLSYGGSSILTTLMSLGLVQAVKNHGKKHPTFDTD